MLSSRAVFFSRVALTDSLNSTTMSSLLTLLFDMLRLMMCCGNTGITDSDTNLESAELLRLRSNSASSDQRSEYQEIENEGPRLNEEADPGWSKEDDKNPGLGYDN